jgi:hypothetical protein
MMPYEIAMIIDLNGNKVGVAPGSLHREHGITSEYVRNNITPFFCWPALFRGDIPSAVFDTIQEIDRRALSNVTVKRPNAVMRSLGFWAPSGPPPPNFSPLTFSLILNFSICLFLLYHRIRCIKLAKRIRDLSEKAMTVSNISRSCQDSPTDFQNAADVAAPVAEFLSEFDTLLEAQQALDVLPPYKTHKYIEECSNLVTLLNLEADLICTKWQLTYQLPTNQPSLKPAENGCEPGGFASLAADKQEDKLRLSSALKSVDLLVDKRKSKPDAVPQCKL